MATGSAFYWCSCLRNWRWKRGSPIASFEICVNGIDARIACEPRHASWFASGIGDWLAERRIVRVAADPAPVKGAGEPGGWNAFAYYRWHGSPRIYYSDYDPASLQRLKQRLDEYFTRGVATWCIFDNTALGAALGNALALTKDGSTDPLLTRAVG